MYINYASYCQELGVDFIAGYYNPRNQALNPSIRTERPYPIVTVQNYLEKIEQSGAFTMKLSISEILTDIRMIVIGNAFEWALHHGNADFEQNIKRSLNQYLDGLFS